MSRILIIIYSVFSIVAFVALTGIAVFFFYSQYTENVTTFSERFEITRNNIRSWYNESPATGVKLFRAKIRDTLSKDSRLFIISIYSTANGLIYAAEKRRNDSVSYIKNNILEDTKKKDPDWEGRPEYRDLPLVRESITKKLTDDPMLYIEAVYLPVLKSEVSGMMKWGLLSLILWLMVTVIIRIFATMQTQPPVFMQDEKAEDRFIKPGSYEYYPVSPVKKTSSSDADDDRPANSFESSAKAGPKIAKESDMKNTDKGTFETAEKKDSPELFSTKTGLGLREFLGQRLGFEINRTASFNQDMVLAFIAIDCIDELENPDEVYKELAKIILDTFPFQDLAFEYGKGCYAVILPDTEFREGIKNLEIFQKKIHGKFIREQSVSVSIGLSARSGRLINPDTIMYETERALGKAQAEGRGHIVAFKADPEKYRNTLS